VSSSATAPAEPGEIITFYSYKGGTGRSMALANVACLLAQSSEGYDGVLMVDWDLEAPGLHRYFADRFERKFPSSDSSAASLKAHPGLIELFCRFQAEIASLPPAAEEPTPEMQDQLRQRIDLDSFILPTDVPNLSIIKAGCFDEDYARRVNTFPWEPLYKQAPWLISFFADWMTSRFRYVLIDSRTGITDTSGICTMLLPDKLVVVFTPNQQSLDGVLEMTERATNYRRRSSDVRPLSVFPLASRIEVSEPALRERWRKADGIGYQPQFEALFKKVWALNDCNLESYLNEVQIQHSSAYAYGEKVAVLYEKSDDRTSLRRAFVSFAERLANLDEPWDTTPATTPNPASAFTELAEYMFAQLTPTVQDNARRVFLQLIKLPPDATRPVAREVSVKLFIGKEHKEVIDLLLSAKILMAREDPDLGKCVCIADESLITHWRRLAEWITADAAFLNWRDTIDSALTSWERHKKGSELLLRGKPLTEAVRQMNGRIRDLNLAEYSFIRSSVSANSKRLLGYAAVAMLAVLIVVGAFFLFRRYQTSSALAQAEATLAQGGLSAAIRAERLVPGSAQIDTALRTLLTQTLQPAYLLNQTQTPKQVVFSPDESSVAAYSDGQVSYLELSGSDASPEGRGIAPLPHGTTAMAISPSKQFTIARGDLFGEIVISTSKDSFSLGVTHTSTQSLAFSPDGGRLVSLGIAGDVFLWDLGQKRLISKTLTDGVIQLLFSPSGDYLVTNNISSLEVWEPPGKELAIFRSTGPISNFCFFPGGDKIAVTHSNNQIAILSFPALKQELTLTSSSPGTPLACSSTNSVWVLLANGMCQHIGFDHTIKNWNPPVQGSTWAAISSSGKYVASTLQNGKGTIISRPDPEHAATYSSLKGTALADAACQKLKPIASVIADYSKACP